MVEKTGWDLERIGNMTPHQTRRIVFHPRDKHGSLILPASPHLAQGLSGSGSDPAKAWADEMRKAGKTDQQIDAEWTALILRMAGVK